MTNPLSEREVEKAFAAAVEKDLYCTVGRIIHESGPSGGVIAAKVADDLHYSAAVIARVLKGLGFPPISSDAINRHRKGACRCAPAAK